MRKREGGILEQEPVRPINGWDCWGLGYLDNDGKKAGCLLHCFQNGGVDYRHLVDYGTKCARELCLEARTFEMLTPPAQQFYLDMTDGMDSFEYSSRKYNPAFGLLVWGTQICESVATHESYIRLAAETVRIRYALLLDALSYKTDGYLIERIVEGKGVGPVLVKEFIDDYFRWREQLLKKMVQQRSALHGRSPENPAAKPVHVFSVPLSFARFLKFSLAVWHATTADVTLLKERIDEEIAALPLAGF